MKLFTKTILSLLSIILLVSVSKGQTPTISSFAPTSGAVGTLVTINGTNLGTLTAFTIGGKSAIVVSLSSTQLVGMVMPGATTGSIFISNNSGSINSSTNFTVTATGYPSVQQGGKLVGTDTIGTAKQGSSVAISADGNTAVLGGASDNNSVGAAWIFVRTGGVWFQQGNKLVGTGNVGSSVQGRSVAISADGNTVAVGGYGDNNEQGAIWVFTRNGNNWVQQGNKLVGSSATGMYAARQGYSIAISADGNTIVSGGYLDNTLQGAIWVFTRNGNIWTQQGNKLVGSGAVGLAQQGSAVSLSADGNTAIMCGVTDNGSQGAAWVFTRSNALWTQQGNKLTGTGNMGSARQGSSVALSADGNTAMIGGENDNAFQGATWIFNRIGNIWTQQGNKLVGNGSIGTTILQGHSIASSADGNIAMIGGYADNSYQGGTWVFYRNGNSWSQQGSKIIGSSGIGSNVSQGISLGLSANGNTAIAGGSSDNSNQGAAWIFTSTTTLPLNLLTFTAQQQNNTVNLAWHTTNEVNTSHFTIQRSVDGATFTAIGKVATKGGGNYVYTDDLSTINNQPSTIYYRLQMVDKDGSFTYSKVVAISLNSKLQTLNLYPNPVKETLFVQLTSTKVEKLTLQITDMQGKVLQQQNVTVGVGNTSSSINTASLAKGSYVLLVKGAELLQQKQFVKE